MSNLRHWFGTDFEGFQWRENNVQDVGTVSDMLIKISDVSFPSIDVIATILLVPKLWNVVPRRDVETGTISKWFQTTFNLWGTSWNMKTVVPTRL